MDRGILIAWFALLLSIRTAPIAAGVDTSTPLHLTEPAPNSVGLYGKYEVTFQIDQVIANPFDSDEIDVQCVFVAPSGRESRVPALSMTGRPASGSCAMLRANSADTRARSWLGEGAGRRNCLFFRSM